ncbi:MAG: carboxypeptidase-like regulatory domain-containing protein [Candidatus Diapherotrites archaeon]
MGLNEFYHGIEDKYYHFLDRLDNAGLPVYKIVDAIEAQNIPSFPIAIFFLLLVMGGLFVFLNPLGGGTSLTVLVYDETQTPLQGITVKLSGNGLTGDALSGRLTDAGGRATFSGLPSGTSITITATSTDYLLSEKSIILDAGENETAIVGTPKTVMKSIALQLYKSNSTESFLEPVSLSFACSQKPSFVKNATVNNGSITVDIPSDCGSLSVQSTNPTIQLETSSIDLDDTSPSLYVKTNPTGNAALQITVVDETGNEVNGITVILVSKFGDQLAQKFTNNGFVTFEGLVPDTYAVFIPSDGVHAELDSGSFEVADGNPVAKTFSLQKASIGEVRLQLVDEGSLSPIPVAKVTLNKGNQVISTKTTNEGGQVTFSVSSTNNLNVSIDHPTYLIKTGYPVTVSNAGYTQIGLTKATPQNSQIVTLHVVDELGQPVENAYVTLKKSPTGASIGPNKITGASGTAVFTSLEEGTYFASAYKPGFSDQLRSDVFTVKARENIEVTVKLVIGTGTVSLIVKGADGQPLAGAVVQPADALTHESFGEGIATGVDGKVELTLRADKFAYFVINEPNHLPLTTIPLQLKKGITQSMDVTLVKDIQKLEVKTLGTFVNNQQVLEESGLAPGQSYTIRLGLYIPKNSVFNEAGVHIRTGTSNEGQTNPIENDGWYIRDVRGAFAKIQKGTTYSPPTGLGVDGQHITSGDAKWANIVFSPIGEGITQIELDVVVKDTAIQGGDLPLYYRAWGKTGSYVRFPVDAVLGGSESVSQKQGLYAIANVKLYSIGAGTHLCSQDICLGLVAEDLANGIQTSLAGEYEADISTAHKLLFTFTSLTENVFQDTSMVISSTSGSASLGAYDVTNAVGVKKTGVVSGNKEEIPLGIIQKNNVVFGFVHFNAAKEGSSKVTLSLVSNKKELFTRDVLIKINAAGIMNVEIIPKVILPLLANQMLIHVIEGVQDIPLENASVTITLNNTLLTSGFTDIEGVYPFELIEPNIGDVVSITVEKPGYKPVTTSLTVGSDILSFVPAQLTETLVVNGTTKKTKDVQFINLASIPLQVEDIILSGDFEELVEFVVLNDEILGETLGINTEKTLSFSLGLTQKGQSLLVGKTLKGNIQVKLNSAETGKSFIASLPLALKIGFGGEVDVEDCLLVEPVQWDIFATPSQLKQQAFEIRNTCTVKGNPVKLVDLSAKVKQLAGDEIGTFTATTDEKNVPLTSGFKVIQNSIPAGGEVTVTITFDPASIDSGLAIPQIVFQALNITETGIPDVLSETVKINAAVNKLKSCVQVKTPSLLEIDSCGINTGAGLYGNYYNQTYRPTGVPYYNPSYSVLNKTTNPSGSSLLPSNQSGAYGAGGYDGYGNYIGAGGIQQFSSNAGGYSQLNGMYANPYVDRYNYGGLQGGMYGCSGTEIRVENSCQTEIEVNLDVNPNLQTNIASFTLKPNENQRVGIYSGYRIGRYDIAINARPKGSTDASKQIDLVRVLVKSPTEINADCIELSKTKFRFNDFIQKPVKGKVINKCYDQGVRLVESADTLTIASFFNAEGALTPDGSGTDKRKNTLVHDIQVIGMQTRGHDRDTYQEMEFQIFPDLTSYKPQPDLSLNEGGIGKRISDIQIFAQGNYYQVESYGTISVKFLDAYGAAQQKPFAVIFENLFNLAPAIDALLQGGNTNITSFGKCINEEALSGLTFGDESFLDGTTITYTTKEPGSVLLTGKVDGELMCGGSDYIGDITSPIELKGVENPLVRATFRRVGKHDVEVTIVRPKNVQEDVHLKGTLRTTVTRVFVNTGTQNVELPIEITVLKPGKTTNIAAFKPLACGYGYYSAESFRDHYGFDKLNWDWTFEKGPDCTKQYCDGVQLLIHTAKKTSKFNTFIKANKTAGVFTNASITYTPENFIEKIIDKTTITSTDYSTGVDTTAEYYLSTDGKILSTYDAGAKKTIENLFKDYLKLPDEGTDKTLTYINNIQEMLNTLKESHRPLYADTLIFFSANKVNSNPTTKELFERLKMDPLGNGEKYYIMTLAEFDELHQQLREEVITDYVMAATTIEVSGVAPVDLTFSDLKSFYQSIDSVVVGYNVAKGGSIITNTEARDYLLSSGKKKGNFTWSEYNDAGTFIKEVLDEKVLLLPQEYPAKLVTDFLATTEVPYSYETNLTTLGVLEAYKKGVTFNDKDNKILADIPTPGQYTFSLSGKWKGNEDKLSSLTVRLSDKDAKTLKDLQPKGKDYVNNPFFYMALDGIVGVDSRSEYGSPFHIDPTTGRLTGNADSDYGTIEEIAEFIGKNENLPLLFKLAINGSSSLNTAYSVPIPLKLRYGSSFGNPAFQYALVERGVPNPGALPANSVQWYDCTSTNTQPVPLLAGAAVCGDNLPAQSYSLTQSFPGEYYYTGILLLPPSNSGKLYDLHVSCAQSEADLQTIKQTYSVDATSDTQKKIINLDESYAGDAAKSVEFSLDGLLDAVEEGVLCAKMDTKGMSIIWNLANTNVTPSTMTCQSVSTAPPAAPPVASPATPPAAPPSSSP